MKTLAVALFTILTAASPTLSAQALSAQEEPTLAGKTVRLPIDTYSLVSEPRFKWLGEQLDRAKSDGATAIELEIDCNGGLAWEARLLVRKLVDLGIPTTARIVGDAAGPAALIALACDSIVIEDGKALGGTVEDIPWHGPVANLPEKLVDKRWEDVMPDILAALQPKGLDENILRGLVDRTPEISIEGELIDGDSDYTSLSLAEARKVIPFAREAAAPAAGSVALSFGEDDLVARDDTAKSEPAESEPADTDPAEDETAADESAEEIETEAKFGETKLESYEGKIVIIEVGDDTLIRSTKFEFMQRVMEKASADGAEAIIFDMDTPGGLAWDTVDIMMDALARVDVPTYTFINTKAMSAGSLIAIATDTIYIHRPGTVGAAGVVSGGGADLPETIKEKITRFVMAAARGTASGKGHGEDIAMAFIDPEIEVTRDLPTVTTDGSLSLFNRKVISPKGEMLVLDADQAVERFDGRPVLAKDYAKSVDDIIAKEGLTGEKVVARPLGFESVADWIVKLAPFLMLLGLAGAYMEMKTPGFGIPGAISLLCFGLFFFGHNLAGKLAGFELFGVLILGLVFVALEIFVFPGLIIFGLLGTFMVVGALVFAMADKYDFQFDEGGEGTGFTFAKLLDVLGTPLFNMALAAGGAIVLILVLLRYLPESRAMRWMMLDKAVAAGTGIVTAGAVLGQPSPLLGLSGEATTDLRPAGKAIFPDQGMVDVITSGEFVTKGSPVRIIEHNGSRVVVEPIA